MTRQRLIGCLSLFTIVASALLLGLGALMLCLQWFTPPSKIAADAAVSAADYFARLGVETTGISCSGADSDHDGYVSCTGALPDGTLKGIECGYATYGSIDALVNRECRLALPTNVGLQVQ